MSVAQTIQTKRSSMTRAEMQLADAILEEYPISGLCSITELAERAAVSTPTVARMVQKLGFPGYGPFQTALRDELGEMISGPIAKGDTWVNDLPEEHILNRYARRSLENQRQTVAQTDPADFDAVCSLIADPARRIYLAGGRITGTLAQYFFLHLQMIRPGVRLLPAGAAWPHDLLDMAAGDVLLAFDVRRYENATLLMGQLCHERGAEVVLFTDQWRSPLHRFARHTFAARIAVPSAWDSAGALTLLVECLVAALQEGRWAQVRDRTAALESAFDRTRLFRKFT